MSLKNWVNDTFMRGISKVYHRSVFTIGLVAIYLMNVLTINNERKRYHPNVLNDFSKVSEENRDVKK